MRNLHKTISLFAEEFVMNYCEEFDAIKSVLEYCNRHVKPLNKVQFRGGNDAFINELAQRLQQVLVERELVDSETKEPLPKAHAVLRKIMMFLLANTDATYKYNIRSDPNFSHVLEICPLLPKFLLVTLVWELKLDQFFGEALSYTPCWFAAQYFEAAADSMKHIDDPYSVLEKVELQIRAIGLSIARSEMRKIDVVEKKIIYSKLYDYTINLLRQFHTPDAEKFRNFKKLQFFHYSGFALKHLLQMVLFSFNLYESPAPLEPEVDIGVFEFFCQDVCPEVKYEQCSSLLKEQQLKICNALLNSLQYNVVLIKIDVFIYWVEIDLSPSQNLQVAIGEMAFNVLQRMQANPHLAHDILPQLREVAIRPKTLEETVQDATLRQILLTLDEPLAPHVKKTWFNELCNRDMAFGNDECIESLRANIKLMTPENSMQAFDFILLDMKRQQAEQQEDIKGEPNANDSGIMEVEYIVDEQLKEVITLALHQFSNEQILKLLQYEVKTFGESTSIFCRPDEFLHNSTSFLNKYTSSFDLQQFLILCFEHPKQMWTKFFDSACNNAEHVRNFCATVKQTRPFSNIYFNTLLDAAMGDEAKMKQAFFPHLLCEIYFVLYYPERKTDFLKQFINKNVNALLDAQNFAPLQVIVKSLNLIESRGETQSYKPLNFGEVTAPVLLMAAQIMDKARWDLITYTDQRDEIVRDCIQFIQCTSKKFLPVATEKDRKWITKVIKDSYRPITQYYFQKYSLPPDQQPVDFDRFLIRLEIEDKSEAEMFLIINYVRCTRKETEWLARSERLLPHISDVLIILSGVVLETDKPNAISNYRHCLVNYANILMKVLLPQIGSDSRKLEKLELKVLKVIEASPAQIYEEVFMNFEWILLEIVKRCERPLTEEGIVKSVPKHVAAMKDCKAKSVFMDKFTALITECVK